MSDIHVTEKPTAPPAVGLQRLVRPFVVIDPYQFDGDVAFGVWDESLQRYKLRDGYCYKNDELEKYGTDAVLLTWSELEARLKRPNAEVIHGGDNER